MTIEKKQAEILDADIDKMIETLREQRKTFKEVDRKSQEGDQVNVDFVGTLSTVKSLTAAKQRGTNLILGSKRMIPGFEEGLVGV